MLKDNIKWLIKNEKGYMIIEVSLALIVIMGLFMGFVMYTNAMRYQLVMSMATKEGARTYMITQNKYSDINRSKEDAIERTKSELILGGVPGASISIEDNEVIVTKPYGFYIPAANRYILNLKAGAEFHAEAELDFYY